MIRIPATQLSSSNNNAAAGLDLHAADCLGLLDGVLRLLVPGLRLLMAEQCLVYTHVKWLRAILRLWMVGMNLLMIARRSKRHTGWVQALTLTPSSEGTLK